MERVIKAGEALGADNLVPIKSAHIRAHYSGLRDAGVEALERFADSGGKFAVPTSVDPASMDLQRWRSFGVAEEYARQQFRLCDAYARLGGLRCWTCTPFQVCNFPRQGEQVAWAGSTAVLFANSVMGVSSNRIETGLDVACAILGLTPRYGLLDDEKRRATIAFRLGLRDPADLDYHSVGFLIGDVAGARVPALLGLPSSATSDDIKHLGASATAAGPVAMIHFPGITPGSPTLSEATGGDQVEEVEVTKSALEGVQSRLSTTAEAPDLVALGTPHLSVNELGGIANMLEGRRVRKGVRLYAYTSAQAYDMAERTGILSAIEASEARVSHSTDAEVSPLKELGFRVVMTDSAKLAQALASQGGLGIRYAPAREIIAEVTE